MSGGLPSPSDLDTTPDKAETTVRMSHDMKKILERIKSRSHYDNLKRAASVHIEDKAFHVNNLCSGLDSTVEMVRFCQKTVGRNHDFRLMDKKVANARLGELEEVLKIELEADKMAALSEAATDIMAAKSLTMRMALIGGLYQAMSDGMYEYKPSDFRDLQDKWTDIEFWLTQSFLSCGVYFQARFSIHKGKTRDYFERYPAQARDIGQKYNDIFYGTKGYDRLVELLGEKPLNDFEEVIGEHINFEIGVKTGW